MNSAIFRAGNIQNVISLDPFAIGQAEVLFGPGSIIYGSDAIGGVMSFQTLNPQLSLTDSVLVSGKAISRFASANSELTHHFDISIGSGKWASLSSISYSRFGDLRMGTRGPDEYLRKFYIQRIDNTDRIVENPNPLLQTPTGYSQTNLMQKVRFKPNQHWEFQYNLHYSETSAFSRYDRLIEVLPSGLPRSAVWNYGPQVWAMNHLSAVHRRGSGPYDQMHLRLAHQYFEESRIDRNFSGGQRFRLRTQLEQVQAYSANLDFEKNTSQHRFYYGLEYVQNRVKSDGSAIDIRDNSPIAVADRYPASRWHSYAAYLNYQYSITDRWMLQAGARYNAFRLYSDFSRLVQFFPFDFTDNNLQNSASIGSVGLVYKSDRDLKISIHTNTGFRAPNVDDIGKLFDFAGGEVVVPNPALKAEYAYNAEANLSKIFGGFLKLDLSAFYTRMDNAMVRRPFRVNGQDSILFGGEMSRAFAIQNAARASVYGFNAGLDVELPFGFSISSSYSYQLGEEEMDNGEQSRSRQAAPAFGMSRLSFQYNKLSMQLYAQYSAEVSYTNLNQEERQKPAIYAKDSDGNPYSPAWHTLNFKAMYQVNQYFTLSTGLENITDQRYRPYSSGLVAPGRNFIISLRAHF
jgi:hemoglobin/transferrin/lactoferrin receptor protein